MHETYLIKPVIDNISSHAKKEGAQKVTRVCLKIGQLTCVKEPSFRETFNILAKGTLLEDAQLEITFSPGSRVEVVSFDID